MPQYESSEPQSYIVSEQIRLAVLSNFGMTFEEVMSQLRDLGDAKTQERHLKSGACGEVFGVKMGDVRALAKKVKTDHALALRLWESGNVDAMILATLLMEPKKLSVDDLDRMVGEVTFALVADWLGTNVVKQHPMIEARREPWMNSDQEMTARMGWSLTTERVIKDPEGLDLSALLDRIEREMGNAPAGAQWTMNYCLGEIGIHFAEHRERAIAIGEKVGAFRDYPVSKGCTSPYVPIWVAEMVRRAG